MTMRTMAFALSAYVMTCAFAVAQNVQADQPAKGRPTPQQVAERKEAFIRKTGGFIRKPKSNSGKVVFINAQKRYALDELEKVADAICRAYRIDVEAKEGTFSTIGDVAASIRGAGGATGIVAAEVDPAMPALIVFPDERCALVNVAAFPKGADAALLRKQVVRGFAAASGALASQIEPTLMSAFENQRKLAVFPSEEIPADVGMRIRNTLRIAGVTPYAVTTYKHACQEGWAPQPTNDVQKAIWDEVHQLPTNPIKIEFDPAKGK